MHKVIRSNKTSWGFTYRKLHNIANATRDDYLNVIKRLRFFDPYMDHVFEEQPVLHIHGVITLPKGFMRARLIEPGMSMKLEEIYDMLGWISYINKQQQQDEA